MVSFDNNFLLLALRKEKTPASVDRARDRVMHLIETLHQSREKIVIPTPVLAEVLVHSGKAGATYLAELQKSSKFKIAAFDTRGGSKETWAKANFDRQIAAISKSEGAHTIYTDDKGVAIPAKRMGMKIVRLADLPLPPSKTPLLDWAENETGTGNRADEPQTKKDPDA
jgi:predicted nucleic acid-binding protein